MKRKELSLYSKIYISVVTFFVVLLIVAAAVLWSLLDAYEKTRPKHAAAKVFNDYFVSADLGALLATYLPERLEFESRESINSGFSKGYDTSKLNYFSVSSGDDGSEKYVVSLDNLRIAYFTLSPTGKSAGFGFKHCVLSDVEFFLADHSDITVKVPKGNTLRINGIDVAERYISNADIKSASCQYMPEGVSGIMYDEYTVSGLLFEPVITVVAENGTELPVSYNEAEHSYTVPIVYNDELAAEQTDYIIKAAREYTKYLSNDAGFGAISVYLDRSSDIYNRVRSIEVNWVRDHNGYKISDETATEFYKYAEGVFSCRVTLKETLSRPGYSDHVEYIDVTFYLRRVDGKYLIYEIVNN